MGMQKELQAAIKAIMPEVECVIGWGSGPDPLHGAPLFMRSEDDANKFEAGFFAVNNPALFLPEYKGKKVAVVVKGCDARSVGQLLSEGLIKREEVSLIGFPCQGVVDHDKVAAALGDNGEMGEVTAVQEEGNALVLTLRGETVRLNKAEVTAEKCLRCQYPNAHIADTFVGEKREPVATADEFADLAAFEAKLEKHQGHLVRAAIELTKDWRTDRVLRRLEAMLAVADLEASLIITGNGDVLEPEQGIVAIGSGGVYAQSAAKALLENTELSAEEIVRKSLAIAGELCIYTNMHHTIETL